MSSPVLLPRRLGLRLGLRLADLLARAARRLSGDANASPVVNLQTNFGGGKTHSLIALYHLAGGYEPATLPGRTSNSLIMAWSSWTRLWQCITYFPSTG